MPANLPATSSLVLGQWTGGLTPRRKRAAARSQAFVEWLAGGPCVGELVAVMSREFAAHPVEVFPKLLGFLRSLGERRLVEPVGDAQTRQEA